MTTDTVKRTGEDRPAITHNTRVMFGMGADDRGNFFPGDHAGILESLGAVCSNIDDQQMADPEQWRDALVSLQPEVLVSGWSTPPMPPGWMESGDHSLKYVCHVTGAVRRLVPRIFLERGGHLTNWGTIAGREVAEHALLLALAVLRKARSWHTLDQTPGSPPATAQLRTRTLHQKWVGIHGFGHVARSLVNLLRPFDVEIFAFSEGVPETFMQSRQVQHCSSLQDLFARSEILFECEALTPASFQSVNAETLSRLPDGAVFVNVGRGQVVDEDALFREAANGRIHIALDVTQNEPLPPDSPLALLPDAIISPHIAGPTHESFRHCGKFALDNVRRYLRGEALLAGISLADYDRST